MKKTYLFCTNWWFYLTELAPAVILTLCLFYNDKVETPGKLYPLIVFCCLCIIFLFLYFFRVISISAEEIRTIGLFSSKDSAVIEKDTTLTMTLLHGDKTRVELFGISNAPGFSWMKGGEYEKSEINLYRERAIGGKSAVKRVLKHFGVKDGDINNSLGNGEFSSNYDSFELYATTENEARKINIRFTKTL